MAALLLVLLCGCEVEITELKPLLPVKERISAHETVDSFIKHHYTDAAYKVLKDIPLIDGPCLTPYVAGVNVWTNILSFFSGNGIGRKVIVRTDWLSNGGALILHHEFLHHLDDITRDGEGDFIDLEEFEEAYRRLARDSVFAGIVHYTENYSNGFWTNIFGVGPMSENIAYSGSKSYVNNAPSYFKRVFRKVFRKWETIR